IAARADMQAADVLALWDASPAAPRRPAAWAPAEREAWAAQTPQPRRVPTPPAGGRPKRSPATPADWAGRMLLEHTGWWELLTAEDHRLL
ncbi:hypothetical protein OFC51_31790, partial [Escherichia coli]|nr:hypothetical protein [Escherichia coli]